MESQSWDLFICHAREDQAQIAWPLKQHLESLGLRVWLDKQNIRPGDSIRQQIDQGILKSRNAVVIFSPSFFQPKYWTKYELDGLIAKASVAAQVVIPIWHLVSKTQVFEYSPTFADRAALMMENGLETVAESIAERIRPLFKRGRLSPREVDAIVNILVQELRQESCATNLLSSHIDEDVMYRLRLALDVSDSDILLNLMRNPAVDGGKRNVATGVLLGERLKPAPRAENDRVASAMREYYRANSSAEARDHERSNAWLVSRGIALALASTSNGGECMVDWIRKLKADRVLLEKNLLYSEEYKGGTEESVTKYCGSIERKFAKYPSGCLWEVFYLGWRAERGGPRVIKLLTRCRQATNDSELRRACDEALRRLS